MNDFTLCQNLVRTFVEEYLNGDIYALADFDFTALRADKRFGCNGRMFDCDDTNLIRTICFLLWGEQFPDLSLADIGSGKKYRGDTLNTFNSVFGTYFPEMLSCKGILKSNAPENIRLQANKFYSDYHTIGNFILLPNIAETDKKRAYTLNTYRGIAYKDYFDLFLCQLDLCLTSGNGDKHLTALIDRNTFFFSWLNENGGLKYFGNICWLEDYFINGVPQSVFKPHIYCLHKKQEWAEREKLNYIKHVEKYMITATTIIKNRAAKIIEQLSVKCR